MEYSKQVKMIAKDICEEMQNTKKVKIRKLKETS
jgi:hypothetical protein